MAESSLDWLDIWKTSCLKPISSEFDNITTVFEVSGRLKFGPKDV